MKKQKSYAGSPVRSSRQRPVSLVAAASLCLLLAAAMRAAPPVTALPPGQEESGLVLQTEIDLARHWADAVTAGQTEWLEDWLGTRLPFRFY